MMNNFTLSSDDIKSCIELACDGVNIHLTSQDKIDAIHKIMYAVAEAAQNNQTVTDQLASNQPREYSINIKSVQTR